MNDAAMVWSCHSLGIVGGAVIVGQFGWVGVAAYAGIWAFLAALAWEAP